MQRAAVSHGKSLIDLDPAVTPPAALTDRIYATLKHRILTCAMMPRARVVEKDLCAEMGVSRTPLREALNRLSLEGLVTILPFRGFIVAPLTVEGFRELSELRRILEPEAAALCAERATDADIARLEGLVEVKYRREDRRTHENFRRANSAFHQTLVRATNNARLEAMVMLAIDQHDRPQHLGLGIGIDVEPSAVEHRRIVETIRARDPEQARRVMREHIMRGEQRIVTALVAGGY